MRYNFLFVLFVGFVLMVSCVTSGSNAVDEPVSQIDEQVQAAGPRYTVIEHKYSLLGGNVPAWVLESAASLEKTDEFAGLYVYRFERTGKDLEGLKILADTLDAGSAIARELETRIQQTFSAAEVGDNDLVETYFENTVNILTDVSVSGYRKYDDFWILRTSNETDDEEYVYYNLYTIARDDVDRTIQDVLSEQPAVTSEEQTARERVREIFANGI
ncbi:MAG: hypothetical protein ACR2PY_04250 [Salinispira sp.]